MNVLVPLVDGFNEIEFSSIVNILRKAKINAITVGLVSSIVEGETKQKIVTDKRITEVDQNKFDALILVGGDPGYKGFLNSSRIINLVKFFNEKEKVIGTIGESVVVLARAGILENRIATCSPGFEKKIPKPRSYKVVRDGHIITGRDASSSIIFSLKIVEKLAGKDKMIDIKDKIGYEG